MYNLDALTTGSKTQDDFTLESPNVVGIGAAYRDDRLLFETDVKWLNWSAATGYDVMKWEDQVVAVGGQYRASERFSVRLGFNHGNNPIKGRRFNGDATVDVQGKSVNAYGFETLRVIGFPAVTTSHVSAGVGYSMSDAVSLNLGYAHGFEEKVRSTGTLPSAFGGNNVVQESKLSEDSFDFSLSWKF